MSLVMREGDMLRGYPSQETCRLVSTGIDFPDHEELVVRLKCTLVRFILYASVFVSEAFIFHIRNSI